MTRPKKICLVLAPLVFITLTAAFYWSLTKPKNYSGHPLDFWLDELAQESSRSNSARTIFLANPNAAIPFLTNALVESPPARRPYLNLLPKIPAKLAMRLPAAPEINYKRRTSAAFQLGELGPTAQSAVPMLLKALVQTDSAPAIFNVVGGNAPSVQLFPTWNSNLRVAAINALAKIDLENAAILTAFRKVAIVDPFERIHSRGRFAESQAALAMLGQAKNPPLAVIEEMLADIEQKDLKGYDGELASFVTTLYPAGRTLGMTYDVLFSETNTAQALTSPTASHREAAAFKLGDPDREGWNRFKKPTPLKLSSHSIALLTKCLNDPEEIVRLNAADTLSKLNYIDHSADLAATIQLLDSTNTLHQLRALELLRRNPHRSAPALPKLSQLTRDPNALIRLWSAKTAREIQSTPAAPPQ